MNATSPRHRILVALFRIEGEFTTADIVGETGLTRDRATREIKAMHRAGEITQVNHRRTYSHDMRQHLWVQA